MAREFPKRDPLQSEAAYDLGQAEGSPDDLVSQVEALDQTNRRQRSEDELSRLLHMVTLDDIVKYMALSNLKDAKVWMNYGGLKNFFELLRQDPIPLLPEGVSEIIQGTYGREIDHCMTRMMGFNGFSYTCNVGDDYWYMDPEPASQKLEWFERMSKKNQAALVVIAGRYGRYLKNIGR